ncbi:MAG: hypothetical protein ACP5UD_09190 [Conexivisphaera sp.]
MAQGEGGGDPFLHYIVTGWIRTHAREFLETVGSFTGGRWGWSRGAPTFVQVEFRPTREERHGGASRSPFKFVDVFMKVLTQSNHGTVQLHYNIIIEVKTGGFTPEWVDQLTELYGMRPAMWGSGAINVLLLVARRHEIGHLLEYLDMLGRTLPKGFFFTFPLEPLMERMKGDLLSMIVNHFLDENERVCAGPLAPPPPMIS